MWPFKKEELETQEADCQQERIDELKAFKNIGEKFNYLGVTIIVTGHSELEVYRHGVDLIPTLKGDYINGKGEIKPISFDYRELPALQAENL